MEHDHTTAGRTSQNGVAWLPNGGSQDTAGDMLELLTLMAWLSHCRARAGEYLHAQQYLGNGVDQLLRMLRRFAAADGFARVCLAVPRRRLDSIAPGLSRELLSVVLGAIPAPEARLLEIAEQRLRPRLRTLDWGELCRVRDRIEKNRQGPAPLREAGARGRPAR